ncbi:unnamed protein product, partial [Laminaria digitata]
YFFLKSLLSYLASSPKKTKCEPFLFFLGLFLVRGAYNRIGDDMCPLRTYTPSPFTYTVIPTLTVDPYNHQQTNKRALLPRKPGKEQTAEQRTTENDQLTT